MTHNIENSKINAAVDMLIESDNDLSNILGKEGLIKQLSKCILERALEAEMQSHLGYDRYERNTSENARNGSFKKNLTTENYPKIHTATPDIAIIFSTSSSEGLYSSKNRSTLYFDNRALTPCRI